MSLLRNLMPLSVVEREELRKLRAKVAYQEKWILDHIETREPEVIVNDRIASLKRALSVLQKRIDNLRRNHPDIWKQYLSKEAR